MAELVNMTARKAKLERSTRETQVSVDICIDGSGKFDVQCDIQFLKHMCESLARYADFDLTLKASGDNDHHIIEDVAITLGQAFAKAVGDEPVERTASCILPMDDALVMVAIDLVDRPYCDADCPDDLYLHFFRSFAMSAGVTLHVVQIRGFDEHHIIEAEFKALGKCLLQATRPRGRLLSTKDAVKTR